MVKHKDEWLKNRKKLRERKKRGAKDGRTRGEPAEFGFPMGDLRSRSSDSSTPAAAGGEAHEHRKNGPRLHQPATEGAPTRGRC